MQGLFKQGDDEMIPIPVMIGIGLYVAKRIIDED